MELRSLEKIKLGKTISAQYTPTVRPDTELVDENGIQLKDIQVKMEQHRRKIMFQNTDL